MLAFCVVFLLFYGFFSVNLFQAIQVVFTDAQQFNSVAQRSYLVWVKENPKEFFYGLGLPIGMVFIYLTAEIVTQLRSMRNFLAH